MKKWFSLFLFVGMMFTGFNVHASENIGRQDIFQNETSILGIEKRGVRLNSDRLSFADGNIFLKTDLYGEVCLDEVKFDGTSYYCDGAKLGFGIGYMYICKRCGVMYDKDPGSCDICGGTDFHLTDLYPEKE